MKKLRDVTIGELRDYCLERLRLNIDCYPCALYGRISCRNFNQLEKKDLDLQMAMNSTRTQTMHI